MGGGGDDMAVGDGAGVMAGGHQPGDVGDICQQVGSHFIGYGAEFLKIDRAGIG